MSEMKSFRSIIFVLVVLFVAAGCASTKVTERQNAVGAGELPRPNRIYVYPFASTPADIPSWSVAASQLPQSQTPPTPEALEAGRLLGALVAEELTARIQKMGLAAAQGNAQTVPQLNDVLITGHFESIEEGGAGKRFVLGFGSGKSELRTVVEGYQRTPAGLRYLGSGKLEAGGNKTPGMIVPVAVFAATANPLGMIVVGATKLAGEASGRSQIEGAAKRTAKEIADQLEANFFKNQGWLP